MLENFIYTKQKSLFEEALNNGEVLDEAIVFIEDTKEIWNHGTYFNGSTFDPSNIEASILNIVDNYATKTEIPTKNSQLKNDSNFFVKETNGDGTKFLSDNGNYKYLWYASRYEWVDLGLPSGLKWASCNIGADSPEEYGLYFAWGETQGYTGCTDTKEFVDEDYELLDFIDNYGGRYKKYDPDVDNLTTLELVDDAAYLSDSLCRMPTLEDFEELINNTTRTPEYYRSIMGMRVRSNINGNSIFIPSSGICTHGNTSLQSGDIGCLWSSSLVEDLKSYAYNFLFNRQLSYTGMTAEATRCIGEPIRPVLEPEKDTTLTPFETLSKINNIENKLTFNGDGSKFLSDDGTYKDINVNEKLEEVIYNITELTYSELKALVDNSELIPGHNYAITDYTCIYRLPTSKAEMEISADDVKYIVCTAVSANELSENVDYIRENGYVKITECKYDINPENVSWTSGMTTKTPKGVVYYMKDERGNECGYDFKHLKFRRWAVTDIAPCTTPDDGATYPCSPYKVYMTNTAALWKDDRKRIGSGAFDDAALIEGVYSGKWVNTTQECKDYFESTDDNPVEFTDEHVLRCVKPYQNSEWPSAKYIAWAPDMNGTDGFANWKSTKTIHHQATVSTDTSDYRDVYTFDCVGLDASEMMVLDTDTYAVYDVSLFNSKGMKNTPLPNTCFVVSDMNSVQSRAYVYSTSIDIAFNNTILLHPATFYYNWASVRDSKINKLEGNLFIIHLLDNFNVSNSVTQSLFNGGINRFYIGKLDKSVFFGYYANNKLESSENLLWYGTHMYVKLTNTTGDYKFFGDGYAYDNELSVFNDSNILSPMLYCRFRSHFNTNTLRSPYTKGLYIESANQGSSYGKCRWGVHICYGAGSFIRYGALQSGTVINTYAFSSGASLTSTGIEKVGTVLYPDLTSTTVKGYYSPGVYLQYLSDKEKAMLSESRPTELIYEGGYASTDGYWKVSYASKGVVGDGIDKLVKLTQAEYDALTTKDDNTLYVITE